MVGYCILTGLVVYYLALWIWYRHADNHTPTDKANNAPLPQSQVSDYTLIGESRYKGGLIGTTADKSGHLPKAAENDTIFAPQVDEQPKESTSAIMPDADEIPDYEHDEPDYEDEEIAGYMGDDDTGRATGVSFDELGEAVRTANADTSTEAEQRQAAGTLASIEGTNLYDAVVENINGGLAKVAELATAVPAEAGGTSKEHETFDMNDFL